MTANMFDGDVFNDNALYDDFATAFAQPFTDVINAPPGFDSSPSPSPLRSSRGTENRAPSSTSPSIPVWKDGSEEEAKVLEDWGIEDSDEEEQAELFNRIPGFEDDWEYEALPARDPEVAQPAGPMDNGYGALQDSFDDTADTEDLDGYYGGDPSDEATGPTTTVDTSHATDSESDEEDLDAIHKHAADSDDSEQVADHEEALALGDEESAAAGFDDSDASSSSESEDPVEPNPVVGPSHQATATPSTPLARPRRSARIARAPKRARPVESEGESDTELARPAKRVKSAPAPRRRATKAETPTSATTSAGASGKRKQRQLSSEPRPSRKTKPKKDAGTRRARIPKWFLDKHCLVAESAQKKCGVKGCNHELHLRQATDARKHIKGHYTKAQREGTEVPCLWEGCNRSIRNDKKNPGGLMRHYDEQHLKLRYQCPGKCTDSQGQPRDWARVDEISRHEMETPCEYCESAFALNHRQNTLLTRSLQCASTPFREARQRIQMNLRSRTSPRSRVLGDA